MGCSPGPSAPWARGSSRSASGKPAKPSAPTAADAAVPLGSTPPSKEKKMRAFGFRKQVQQVDRPVELREVYLGMTLAELDEVVSFLLETRDKLAEGTPTAGETKYHLSHFSRTLKRSDCDLIVGYDGP